MVLPFTPVRSASLAMVVAIDAIVVIYLASAELLKPLAVRSRH
jgi:hypothetical protein